MYKRKMKTDILLIVCAKDLAYFSQPHCWVDMIVSIIEMRN